MTRTFFLFLIFFSYFFVNAQESDKVLDKMYKRYAGKWYKTLTYTQATENYRNDTLVSSGNWYRTIAYPSKMRIDYEAIEKNNASIYNGDSSCRIRNGKSRCFNMGFDPLFFSGGMFFYPKDTLYSRLKKEGYDLTKTHYLKWKGRNTYVIGAMPGDTTTKQMWIDMENLFVVRSIQKNNSGIMDNQSDGFIKAGNGWIEVSVIVFQNGKVIFKERNFEIKTDIEIDSRLFKTSSPG